MSEFNSHQYYGYSMNHRKTKFERTTAKTTSKDFNYRHVRPEYLDRGYQKPHKSATEPNEKSPPKPISNIHRATTPELLAEIAALRRDTDIETHVTSGTLNQAATTSNAQKIRDISDEEIEELIRKLKHRDKETPTSRNSKPQYYGNFEKLLEDQQSPRSGQGAKSPLVSPSGRNRGILRKPSHNETFTKDIAEDPNQTYNISPGRKSPRNSGVLHKVEFLESQEKPSPQLAKILEPVRMEEYRRPQAKWVEVLEVSRETCLEEEIDRPTCSYDSQYLPATLMNEIVRETSQTTSSYMNLNPYEECGTMDTYIVEEEETDSEFERLYRENYMKAMPEKPLPQDILNLSMDDEDSLAEFIALESNLKDMDVTYLKNPGTLNYTEVTEEDMQNDPQLKVYINGQETQRSYYPEDMLPQCSSYLDTFHEEYLSHMKTLQKAKATTARTLREQHLQRTFERLAAGGGSGPSTRRSHANCSRCAVETIQSQRSSKAPTNRSTSSAQPQAVAESCSQRGSAKSKAKHSGNHSNRKNLKVSKSIEDLKADKTNIYKKMSATQEKIIEVLDKLRIGLLESNVPDNSLEKNKRQKNAFEFAVRFSRNFLYPLKGMLEDFKSTPIEQFNSLTSNDASLRVCNLFSLLLQSVNTYQKQLRYFLLDHVPQKLPILLEMIYMTTSQCLEKQIFSAQDVILDSLQQRCTKFFDFLQDLQDGRLNTARENHRKLTMDKAKPKYDLKMFMNDLNMYEPKLVPKSANRKKIKPKRPIKSVPIDDLMDDTIKEKPQDDTIPTQIESIPLENKSSTSLKLGSGDANSHGMDKSVLEALQNLTKEQVRKVLEPMLKALSLSLGKQNNNNNNNNENPLDTEAIVKAFQNKVFSTLDAEKQLNSNNSGGNGGNNKCLENQGNNNNNKGFDVELCPEDSLVDISTCKPLKAAISTKTQSQQNKQRYGGESIPSNINNDDNNNNTNKNDGNHIKSNTTNTLLLHHERQSNSKHHSIQQQRINVVDKSSNNNHNNDNNGIAKQQQKQRYNKHRGSLKGVVGNINSPTNADATIPTKTETTAAAATEVPPIEGRATTLQRAENKINKSSKKLMNEVHNEDQIDKELQGKDKEKQQPQQHWAQDKFPGFKGGRQDLSHSSSTSSSDSEAGHNPKLKNNKQYPSYYLQPRPTKSCSQSRTSHTTKSSTTTTTSQRHSLPTLSAKSNNKKTSKKRDPLTPPAPSVTPSSSGGHLATSSYKSLHFAKNNSNYDFSHQQQHQISLEDLKIPLTANASDLQSMQTFDTFDPSPQFDESDNSSDVEENHYTERNVSTNRRSKATLSSAKSCGDFYEKGPLPLYLNKSPYTTSEQNTPHRLRPLPMNKLQKLQPKPSPKLIREQLAAAHSLSFKENQSPSAEGDYTKEEDRCYEQIIRKRNQFLKSCEKNRFYRNPNFPEPWKVFATLSERLLDEVLNDIENDFSAGVSKFVDDFLELEIRT
ncbi:uncharacterized protein [Musca autumnalis]|uniref:uncharacterized protein n=1 Tax=Musca autumnalis TaxID=221902 RepID=UPI003CE68640